MFNKFLDEDDVYKLKEDAAEDADGVNGGVIERELELLLLPLALPLALLFVLVLMLLVLVLSLVV